MNTTYIMPQMDLLELAGHMLEKQNYEDFCSPGLLDMTGVSRLGSATGSGLNNYDYQSIANLSSSHTPLHQLQTINKVPIPPEILEHFKHAKCHCMMGLFPEIGRAWLTIDSEIYIWTYEHARDVAYYDGITHLIVSVGLVKPKAGVFIDDIKYLLILTTPAEIVILGVTFGETTKTLSAPIGKISNTYSFEEMQLMSKPIFVLSTDNIAINVILGSSDGRIFLGGRDGCLYEIHYQAESSWFGKRSRKINHSQSIVTYMLPSFLNFFTDRDSIKRMVIDNSRQLLYTLTESGTIEAWNMTNNCNTMCRIARVSQNELAICASRIIKTVDCSVFKPITSICPISRDDCPSLHLLAITQSGVRLYFSTKSLANASRCSDQAQVNSTSTQNTTSSITTPPTTTTTNISNSKSPPPQGLYLLHVRLPPGYTPNATVNKPKQVQIAHYNEGSLLLISSSQQDQDILWLISSAPFLRYTYLTESTTVLSLDGVVWDLAEAPNRSRSNLQSTLRKSQQPRRVVLLTNRGIHIIALLKPIDILQQLLIACKGPQHPSIKAFFEIQGEKEACITALLLACSEQYKGTDLAMWAAQAFLLYGGEPVLTQQLQLKEQGQRTNLNGLGTSGSNAEVIRQSPQMFMSTPMSYVNTSTGRIAHANASIQNSLQQSQFPLSPIKQNHPVKDTNGVIFSARHNSLYLYMARLMRPIWKLACIDGNFNSTLSAADCTIILEDLFLIKIFLENNLINDLLYTMKSYIVSSQANCGAMIQGVEMSAHHHSTSNDMQSNNSTEQAQTEEKRSFNALNQFIKNACEVMALWKILCEHQFQQLICQLLPDQQKTLLTCTFRDLILARSDFCIVLIVALINSYLNDNASVGAISAKLRDVCPNLYRHEDAVTFKATEILMKAKNSCLPEDKEEKLRTALQLCKNAAPNLPLQNICHEFTLCDFYEGVLELTSTCASKSDNEALAIHFYLNNEPEEDSEGYSAYASRMKCYKEVRIMLDHIYQSACNIKAAAASTHNTEFPTKIDQCQNQILNVSDQIMKIVKTAVSYKDPLLHVCVYEWLLGHDMLSELLSLRESSLGEFLQRSVRRNSQNLKLVDLLWKYYEKNGHHAQAAQILDNLASTQDNTITLEERIEYLARAVMCMRNECVGYSVANGILLKELEDKLEISRVQKTVLDAVTALQASGLDVEKSINDLNANLYDITQLYEHFADPLNLWECKLKILNCSHHNDPLLIESVWGQIINKACEELGSVQDRSTRLFSKIEMLAKEFRESGHCFPMAFIIRELEIKACQMRLPAGIVPQKLFAMNLDIELLMEYYSRMLSINERIWANEGSEWQLVESAACVITLLADNMNTLWTRSKRRIIGKAQDMVSVCLNLCYQKPNTEGMQQTLKGLQCRLMRSLM